MSKNDMRTYKLTPEDILRKNNICGEVRDVTEIDGVSLIFWTTEEGNTYSGIFDVDGRMATF